MNVCPVVFKSCISSLLSRDGFVLLNSLPRIVYTTYMTLSRKNRTSRRCSGSSAGGIDPERLLLKAPEVARMLGLARSTVYVMISAGELESVRKGKSVRVPRAALDEWIKRNTRKG